MSIHNTKPTTWEKAPSIYDYGGTLNKRNYLGLGVVDPDTDFSADNVVNISQDLAAVVRVAPFATLSYSTQSSGFLEFYRGMNGSGEANAPTITRLGTGNIRVLIPSTYVSEYGKEATVSLKGCPQVSCYAEGLLLCPIITNISGNQFEVKIVKLSDQTAVNGIITITYWVE